MTWIKAEKRSGVINRTRNPPALRWSRGASGRKHVARAVARLNVAFAELFLAKAHELGVVDPIGAQVLIGTEDDEGRFALVPATFHGTAVSRDVFALTSEYVLSCGDLCDKQERGWSPMIWREDDKAFVGKFGVTDPPRKKGKKR